MSSEGHLGQGAKVINPVKLGRVRGDVISSKKQVDRIWMAGPE